MCSELSLLTTFYNQFVKNTKQRNNIKSYKGKTANSLMKSMNQNTINSLLNNFEIQEKMEWCISILESK